MTIFPKYYDKYESHPPVGAYNPDDADRWTKTRTRAALIDPGNSYKKKEDPTPPPGAYTKMSDLPFGKSVAQKNFTLGGKYKFETNENPAPGAYNPELADSHTKFRNKTTLIRPESSPYRRPKEALPDPG
jgi:hypothetical protein